MVMTGFGRPVRLKLEDFRLQKQHSANSTELETIGEPPTMQPRRGETLQGRVRLRGKPEDVCPGDPWERRIGSAQQLRRRI